MRAFFKQLATTLLALCLFFGGAATLILLLVIGLIAVLSIEEPVEVQSGSILVINLSAAITDSPPAVQGNLLRKLVDGDGTPHLYLWQIVDCLQRAAEDERIAGVFLHGNLMSGSGTELGCLQNIRNALLQFRELGKPVIAHMRNPGVLDYYIASAANRVAVDHMTWIDLTGLSTEAIFLGPALEKYGIGVQVTRAGDFKSAVEPFTRADFSDEARLQLEELYWHLWQQILFDIDESRGLGLDVLEGVVREQGVISAQVAMDLGLVDEVAALDEIIGYLKEVGAEDADNNTFLQVSIDEYYTDTQQFYGETYTDRTVAVVYLEGDIVDGEGYPDQAGGDRIARELRRLRQDPNVCAIVMRVNSPGGSAFAAEVIRRELMLCREKMPVVVSMGGVAASGAYWIATAGDVIIAEPMTVTGSIGVFGLMINIQELAQRHGVSFDGVKTGPFADLGTITRPMTDAEMAKIHSITEYIYDEFLTHVANGRNLDRAVVEQLAGGRVWSGLAAVQIGLVDDFGGLGAAIAEAAERADVSERYSIMQVPEPIPFLDYMLDSLLVPDQTPPLVKAVGLSLNESQQGMLHMLKSLNDPRGVYARLPYWLVE